MDFKRNLELQTILDSDNVATKMHKDDLGLLGSEVVQGYNNDLTSRSAWEDRYAAAMNLALQVTEHKSFPWEGAANVKIPLITMAAMQYAARAYPALVKDTGVVGCQVIGDDPDGEKAARAKRVSEHMSYQLSEEDTAWESGTDTALLVHAIVGCSFKKTYYDAVAEIKRSEHVFPKDLVVDYYTKDFESAARVTQTINLSFNTCKERELQGIYLECDEETASDDGGAIEEAEDNRQGIWSGDGEAPVTVIEQHGWWDLDGDGLKEPYIVTVQHRTQKVLRVYPRYSKANIKWSKDREIIQIRPELYFTKYTFIPSPDGGFYDVGFGQLLNGVGNAADTVMNQLIDAGTMQTAGGGFLGRGVKIRGGDYSFKPNEWKRTDSTGEDLKSNIVPRPSSEPSAVLFQLLNLLIDFGTKIGGVTDPMVGENPGQNTPAETSRNTIAQGQKVFNAVYKRVYRAMKQEFRKLYRLNYLYPPDSGKYEYSANGKGGTASVQDYYPNEKGVIPSADPSITSDEEQKAQVNDIFALMQGPLGARVNEDDLIKRFNASRRITNPAALWKPPQPPVQPPPDPKIVVAQMQAETAKAELQFKNAKLLSEVQQEIATLQETARKNDAQIQLWESQGALAVSQAQGEADYAQIGLINAQVSAAKIRGDEVQRQQDELHHQRDTLIAYLEHARNVQKDKNDA